MAATAPPTSLIRSASFYGNVWGRSSGRGPESVTCAYRPERQRRRRLGLVLVSVSVSVLAAAPTPAPTTVQVRLPVGEREGWEGVACLRKWRSKLNFVY